ncbi:glycerol-3-phosphate responsive antiterminator [Paenibacillus filicis]|uniref:Glycerol uptake operon antiterminator regulatory protein n=1 Tax=Paenibacillus gyeongsangnamensis TaxID=3388067 RepID=A0ABT4Q1Z1_9BACL|nr:glycerol-3-phosphate responsive antiterminator [Paenibacillus filicis]MCZ8510897.1 glycerol-3-phosphate responsive antiterminator [Paenibacillus filicis]
MRKEEFYLSLAKYKKVASVTQVKHIEKVLEHQVSGVFLFAGNIGMIKRYVDFYKSHNLFVFLHMEKIRELQSNRESLEFISNYIKPTGIISTKNTVIQQAKKLNLLTIQRLFLIDFDALHTGMESFQETKPDAIELLPGLLPDMVATIKKQTDIPIITGWLISTREQMIAPIQKGALAVSTGNPELWGADLTNG